MLYLVESQGTLLTRTKYIIGELSPDVQSIYLLEPPQSSQGPGKVMTSSFRTHTLYRKVPTVGLIFSKRKTVRNYANSKMTNVPILSLCEQRNTKPNVCNTLHLKRMKVERHHVEERFIFQQKQSDDVVMIGLRRKTRLVTFLIVLCQFAMVDPNNLIPAGIILYAIGIGVGLELLHNENKQDESIYDEEKEFQRLYDMAKFEYIVLKQRPKTRFYRVRQNGELHLFVS